MIELSATSAFKILYPLLLFIAGMVTYSLFVYKFYKFVARKDIFSLNLQKYNTSPHPIFHRLTAVVLYLLEYVLFFPILAFFWFGVITFLLTLLAREQTIQHITLVSIAVLTTIRITAYYTEDLSRDLAKMLPFALLGVFLVDFTFFSFTEAYDLIMQLPSMVNIIIYYFLFVVLMEFFLRMSYLFVRLFR